MHWTKEEIQKQGKVFRLNLINGITGAKAANLIGSVDLNGNNNLAIFSSLVHLGSHPALLGLIVRPSGEVTRNTYENIKKTGFYTIYHVNENIVQNAHYTSAKFEKEVSEFDLCGLTAEFKKDFAAPYVLESQLKIGMHYVQEIPIELNGTILLIGEIEHIYLPEGSIDDAGQLDLERSESLAVSGLNTYYTVKKKAMFPYARIHEIPDFQRKR